jgi:hypothetical protein
MLSGDLPYDEVNKEVIGIAFVRNPVDRFISSYNMQRSEIYRGGIAKYHDFEAFYTKAIVNTIDPFWRNGQTYILGGSGTESGLAAISERVKSGQLLLLPTERFDDACVVLEKLYPNDFRDCSYTRYNASKQNEYISEQLRAAIAQYMDIDFKLLALANEYLDSTLKRVFADISENKRYLNAFQHRCKLKKQRKRVAYAVKNIKSTLKSVLKKSAKHT